jgi:hypothetical protein
MSMEKIATTSEKDLITLDTSEMNKDKLSGRVDINHLIARVRKEQKKEYMTSLLFFALFSSFILVVGLILYF